PGSLRTCLGSGVVDLGVEVLLRRHLVGVGLGHLLHEALVQGLAGALLERRVPVSLARRPLLRRGVALVERVGQSPVGVGEAVAGALRLRLVVDAVAVVALVVGLVSVASHADLHVSYGSSASWRYSQCTRSRPVASRAGSGAFTMAVTEGFEPSVDSRPQT